MNILVGLITFINFYKEAIENLGVNVELYCLTLMLILNSNLIYYFLTNKKKLTKRVKKETVYYFIFLSFVFIFTILRSDYDSIFLLEYSIYFNIAIYLFIIKVRVSDLNKSLFLILIIYVFDVESLFKSIELNSRGALSAGPISIALISMLYLSILKINFRSLLPGILCVSLVVISQSKGPIVAFVMSKIIKMGFSIKRFSVIAIIISIISVYVYTQQDILRLSSALERTKIINLHLNNLDWLGYGTNSSQLNFGHYPHNLFIQLLYEQGIVMGSVIIILFLYFSYKKFNNFSLILTFSSLVSFNSILMLPIILIAMLLKKE